MKKIPFLLLLLSVAILGGCSTEDSNNEPTSIPGEESGAEEQAPLATVEGESGRPAEYPGPADPAGPRPEDGYPAPVSTLPAASYPEPPEPQLPVGAYPANTVWVIHPLGQQCQDPLFENERAATRVLAEAGVTVLSAETVDLNVCQACDCPTSAHIRVLIDEKDVPVVEAMDWQVE